MNESSCSHTEARGYSEMISHVGVDGLPESSINCHRTLSGPHSASIVGTLQRTDRYKSARSAIFDCCFRQDEQGFDANTSDLINKYVFFLN